MCSRSGGALPYAVQARMKRDGSSGMALLGVSARDHRGNIKAVQSEIRFESLLWRGHRFDWVLFWYVWLVKL
jgi:hypothetical protein